MDVRTDRIGGALLGTFLGDALGRSLEGAGTVEREEAARRLDRVVRGRAPLRYTDDTQLALALAEHLVEVPSVCPEGLREAFLEVVEPPRGYGGGMLAVVDAWRRGVPLDEAAEVAFRGGSFGNGAAMRVAPLAALWADRPDELDAVVERASRLTHVHPVGLDGARVQAHAVAAAVRTGRFDADVFDAVAGRARTEPVRGALAEARRLLSGEPTLGEVAARVGNGVVAARSVPTALWAAASAADVRDAALRVLGVAGDTDTIGAMTLAIRGAAGGLARLPADWCEVLEDGPRGRAYAEELARRLARVTLP